MIFVSSTALKYNERGVNMDELKKRKSPRHQGFDYKTTGVYFITICTQNRLCILSRIVGTDVLDCPQPELTKYGEIAKKHIKQLNEFYHHLSVEAYVIMPNHIHILLFVRKNGQSRTPVPTTNQLHTPHFAKRMCAVA